MSGAVIGYSWFWRWAQLREARLWLSLSPCPVLLLLAGRLAPSGHRQLVKSGPQQGAAFLGPSDSSQRP